MPSLNPWRSVAPIQKPTRVEIMWAGAAQSGPAPEDDRQIMVPIAAVHQDRLGYFLFAFGKGHATRKPVIVQHKDQYSSLAAVTGSFPSGELIVTSSDRPLLDGASLELAGYRPTPFACVQQQPRGPQNRNG